MQEYVTTAKAYAKTRRADGLVGMRVLAKSGSVLGKVRAVLLDPAGRTVQGILVGRLLHENLYITTSYIDRITEKAVLLKIDPASLRKGLQVITSDGKRVGTVIGMHRIKQTNDVHTYVVKRRFRTFEVAAADVKHIGTSLILKKTYATLKKKLKK